MLYLQNADLICSFDETTGQPLWVRRGGLYIPISSFGFDFGCNERMVNGLLAYESMLEFRTWVLPAIRPTGRRFALTPVSIAHDAETVAVTYNCSPVLVTVTYTLLDTNLRVDLKLMNRGTDVLYLNACAFLLALPTTDLTFDFPAQLWRVDLRKYLLPYLKSKSKND